MAPPPTCIETTSPPTCQVSCASTPTTITGTVYAPNGTLPLYNAIVYIPSQTPGAFTSGVTCDACDGQVSGAPIVTALTGPDGTFSLPNVPPGNNIPLVVQLGKWRVQTTIPSVASCASTAVDKSLTTLPANSSQGDMPKMAIATGSADPFECLLLKIGIDPAEIQPDSANKRIAFFTGAHSPGTTMSGAGDGTTLYPSLAKLMTYDIVMLPCEGGEFDQSTDGNDAPLATDPRGLIAQYVNMGGRLFSTHFSYDWLTYAGSPFNAISQPLTNGLWDKNQTDYPPSDTTVTTAQLVTTFPKGLAFAQWLIAAGAQSAMNTLNILAIRHDIDGVDPTLGTVWATDNMPAKKGGTGAAGIAHLTFNTPLDPASTIDNPGLYCGRVVFSDFHVASDEVSLLDNTFPGACVAGALTDQEKALAFMLFDLSSCVQPDGVPPVIPIT